MLETILGANKSTVSMLLSLMMLISPPEDWFKTLRLLISPLYVCMLESLMMLITPPGEWWKTLRLQIFHCRDVETSQNVNYSAERMLKTTLHGKYSIGETMETIQNANFSTEGMVETILLFTDDSYLN